MSYKLIVTDVDGTLIDKEHNIPTYNVQVIKELQAKGIPLAIATGRNDTHVLNLVQELGADGYVIGCNGATVTNVLTGETLSIQGMDKEMLKTLFDFFTKNNVDFKANTFDEILTTELVEDKFYKDVTKGAQSANIAVTFLVMSAEEMINKDIIKIIVVNDDKDYLTWVQAKLLEDTGIEALRSADTCIDIVKKDVSKWTGIQILAEKLGISTEEVVALGDNENDREMLQNVGFSVAMGNAPDHIKELADMVTDVHTEAGLGKALAKIFKLV